VISQEINIESKIASEGGFLLSGVSSGISSEWCNFVGRPLVALIVLRGPSVEVASHTNLISVHDLREAPFLNGIHGIDEIAIFVIIPDNIPELFQDLLFLVPWQLGDFNLFYLHLGILRLHFWIINILNICHLFIWLIPDGNFV
jgi:hypothetical protein